MLWATMASNTSLPGGVVVVVVEEVALWPQGRVESESEKDLRSRRHLALQLQDSASGSRPRKLTPGSKMKTP